MATINEAKRITKRIILSNLQTNDYTIALTPLISGKHGIGKSQIAKQIANDLGGVAITIEGGTLKEGEITGIPYQYRNDNGEVEFRFLPYYAVDRIQKAEKLIAKGKAINSIEKILEGDENKYSVDNLTFDEKKNLIRSGEIKPVILFFDEINRTDVSVFRELMNIILTRTVNGYRLPWWVFIVAAMNPSSQNSYYATNEMDPAQLDRFIKIKVKENSDEWISYALENNVDDTLISFIAGNDEALSSNNKLLEDTDKPEPSPRGWNMIDMILKGKKELNCFFNEEEQKNTDKDIRTIIAAKVGAEASAMYYSSLNDASKIVLATDIFTNKGSELSSEVTNRLKKQSTARCAVTSKSICAWLKENVKVLQNDEIQRNRVVKLVAQFMAVINSSSKLLFAQSLIKISDDKINIFNLMLDVFDDEMVELLQKNNMNEELLKENK